MLEIIYLSYNQILEIHEKLIELFGGSNGVRDEHLVNSALERPKVSYMGEDLYPNIFFKASALGHSIILNHPFLDGNKRTGMVSMMVFLELNGFSLEVDQKDLVETAVKVATKKITVEEIALWLETHSEKVS